jgi:hypothetical protein
LKFITGTDLGSGKVEKLRNPRNKKVIIALRNIFILLLFESEAITSKLEMGFAGNLF